jgi:AcrR family transcriptional regulator
MARRQDHTPEALRALLLQTARSLIVAKGVRGLTARALAAKIGYAPGTIYNVFADMDALLLAVHGETLAALGSALQQTIATTPPGFTRIQALAQTYCRFAETQAPLWLALFATPHRGRLPRWYQQQLQALFTLLEEQLRLCLGQGVAESRRTARLLWACLHGITMLTLDGRLRGIGGSKTDELVTALLQPYQP